MINTLQELKEEIERIEKSNPELMGLPLECYHVEHGNSYAFQIIDDSLENHVEINIEDIEPIKP